MSPRSLVGPYWQLLRLRRPAAAERLEDLALAARGRAALTGEVRALRRRLAELERDHLLLAAHVATLTAAGAAPASAGVPDGAEDARRRTRLAAVAAYEQRIGALEEGLAALRRARSAAGRASSRRIPHERAGGPR